jgi:hypothetical protein
LSIWIRVKVKVRERERGRSGGEEKKKKLNFELRRETTSRGKWGCSKKANVGEMQPERRPT